MNLTLDFLKHNASKFLVYLTFLGIPNKSISQQNYSDSLNILLNSAFEKSKIPGCAITITNKDGIIYQKAFGFADVKNKKPFNLETTINVASVSKTFISVALMKAIELGYFNLETEINNILPFKVYNPYFPKKPIRIKHLVTHTSGIIDRDSVYSKCYNFILNDQTDSNSLALVTEAGLLGGLKEKTLEDFMFSYLDINGNLYSKYNFSNSQVGKNFNYSNIASALIAYLIEIKSKTSFLDFTDRYIFNPLKMEHTEWLVNNKIQINRAIPYYNSDTPFPFYTSITYPDGGLVTSATELSRFVQEMIKTLNNTSQILSSKMSRRMFHPFFKNTEKIGNYDITKYNNGVFWEIYPDNYIGHPGADPGVSSFIEFNKDVGFVFLANSYTDIEEFRIIIKKYAQKVSKY